MNKMKDNNPLYRTNGSIDIAGAVRSILAITRTPNKEAPAERYLVQVKSNLAPTGSAILFEVAEKGVDFISEMEMTAEEAFLSLAPQMGRPNEKEMKAKSLALYSQHMFCLSYGSATYSSFSKPFIDFF